MTLVEGKQRRKSRACRFLTISLIWFAPFVCFSWAAGAFPLENKACLECHGSRDILHMGAKERLEMVLPTPERQEVRKGGLTLYVDDGQFRSTVHRQLLCIDCHTDVKTLPHPQRLRMVNCAQCHQEIVGQYEKSTHAGVSNRPCIECHNPHATISCKKLSQEERMGICLTYHKGDGHQWLPQRKNGYTWLDVIGILCIAGGLGFVGVHAFIRIFTIQLRKQRH
jgi:predicted CXXCH cytochrome family protein